MPVAVEGAVAAPLVGSLADFPVDQVLQLIGGGGRSGTFRVTGPLPLDLVVDDGAIGPPAEETGGDAGRAGLVEDLFHLLLIGDGDFAFEPSSPGGSGARWPLAELLADVTGRVTRWRAISAVLPSLDVVVRLLPVEAEGEPLALTRTGWNVAVALDGTRRVRDVTVLLGGDAFDTMEALHDLVQRGLAEVVEAAPAT